MKTLTKVNLTNLGKILFPTAGIKKSEVIKYYIEVAPKMLNFLAERPLVMTRFPEGVTETGFYEKNAPHGTPTWVKTFKIHSESAEKDINYVIVDQLDSLIWAANLAAIELHMTLSRITSYKNPDLLLFDVDPEPPANFSDAIDVTLILKEQLDDLGLKAFVKTSGKKGFHVLVPIKPIYTFKQTREYVREIGRYLTKKSNLIVSEFSQTKEPGKVFIDFMQNNSGRTMICPYSLRATPSATVSTPLSWQDLRQKIKPEAYTIRTVGKIQENPWEDLFQNPQRLEVV